MQHSKFLAAFILVSLVLSVAPVQQARAQGSYTEEFSAFFAGTSALWWMSFGGVNGSAHLSAVEAIPGVASYNVTAIRTTGWLSDFQIFGPNGYSLIPVPFIPNEGLFLRVGADSYADAVSAATALDSYLLSSFVSLSNGSSSFTFYSPLSFNAVVPKTLLRLVPFEAGGFASAFTATSFMGLQSQTIMFGAQRTQSGFTRTVAVGSITNTALDTLDRPNLPSFFGTSNSSLAASKHSSSSIVHLRFLDGIVTTRDKASVSNTTSSFHGDYRISMAAGQRVSRLNATILEIPPQLLATRVMDTGVLNSGRNVSVSISLRNLTNSTRLDNVTLADNWWVGNGFKLVSSNSGISVAALGPGESRSVTYVLQYNGSSTGFFTIPAAVVRFSFILNGAEYSGHATLNPITLSLNAANPVLTATVSPSGNYGAPVGGTQYLKLSIRNIGTETATSVTAAGQTISGIIAGETLSLIIPERSPGMLGVNATRSFEITYKNQQGTSLNATSNVMPLIFSHSDMKIGFPVVAVAAVVSSLPGGIGNNLTLTFTTTNRGHVNVTSFSAQVSVGSGLGCGSASGSGLSCASGLISLNYPILPAQASRVASEKYSIHALMNQFVPSVAFSAVTGGFNLSGRSNAITAPSGLLLTKVFTPGNLFPGMISQVGITARNSGPFQIFNSTVSTSADAFDTLKGPGPTSGSAHAIVPGGKLNFSYSVRALSVFGNLSTVPVSATFFIGGRQYTVTVSSPSVSVYPPLVATITASPSSPSEGTDFSLGVTLSNPSGLQVSNVQFKLPLPTGLSLSRLGNATVANGFLIVSTPTMNPHSVLVATGVGTASSGLSVPYAHSNLTFTYAGATILGKVPTQGFVIGENTTLRYLLPTGLVFVILLAAAFYIRRQAAATAQASQK